MSAYDLFDLNLDERVHGRKKSQDEFIEGTWKHWELVSNRPASQAPDRFRKAIRDALAERHSEDRITRAISGAVHLRPANRDPMDVRRVIQAVSNSQIEAQVLSLLDSGDAPVYTWDSGDPEARLSELSDLRESCGLDLDLWTHRDHESSGIILQTLTPEKLKDAAHRVKIHLGNDTVSPSEIIRWSSLWRNPDKKVRVSSNSNRDTYSSGKQESDALSGIDIGLDKIAEKALISGCPASTIREFHLQAPDGYWSRVSDEIDENLSATLESVYEMLRGDFSWHPSDRGEPTW